MSMNSATTPRFAFIRALVFRSIIEHFDYDLSRIRTIIRQNGVSFTVLDEPYAPIPLHSYLHILDQAASLSGDPLFGARLGFSSRPGNIAPVGLLAIQLSSIERGLEAMVRYSTALQSGTRMKLERDEDHLILSYLITEPANAPLRQDAEFSLASTCNLIRGAFDARWRPLEIHFCHAAPSPAVKIALRKLFGGPVLFSQPENRIVMALDDAQRPHRSEDRDMIAMTERHLMDLIQRTQRTASISEQVEALVGMYLGSLEVKLETIAAAMQMSARSLQRKLSEEGQSLSTIVQRHRQAKAETMLAEGGMTVEKIATALGYADGTAFWRAYRSWTGHSPSRRTRQRPSKAMAGSRRLNGS